MKQYQSSTLTGVSKPLPNVLQISAAEVVEDADMGSTVNEGFYKGGCR
jgi:hypothetical protein